MSLPAALGLGALSGVAATASLVAGLTSTPARAAGASATPSTRSAASVPALAGARIALGAVGAAAGGVPRTDTASLVEGGAAAGRSSGPQSATAGSDTAVEVGVVPSGPATSSLGSPGHPLDPGRIPAGFPTAATTGVPAGTTLRPYRGDLVIRRSGTVISDALVTGCLVVQAQGVVIRDSRIVCHQARAALLFAQPDVRNPRLSQVSDVEIDGTGVATVGLGAKDVVATGLSIHDTGDGVHLGTDSTLQDSFIDDLADQPELHHDDLQTLHGSTATHVRVLHNTLLNPGGNSVYHLGSGAISDFLVAGNYLNGGHYSVQVANGPQQQGLRFVDNTFGFDYRFAILELGQRGGPAVSFNKNVFVDGSRATATTSRGRGTAGS